MIKSSKKARVTVSIMGFVSALCSRRIIFAIGLVASLAACGGIAELAAPPPKLFVLTPKSTFTEKLPTVKWQLVVEEPVVARALDVPRVALLRTPTNLDYINGAAWAERAPTMVHTLLIESFENSGKITSIGRQVIGLRSDFNLKSELREFQVEYYPKAGPRVRVRLNLALVKQPRRNIVAIKTVEALVPVSGRSLPEIVRGFDEALGRVLKKSVIWTLKQGELHKGKNKF